METQGGPSQPGMMGRSPASRGMGGDWRARLAAPQTTHTSETKPFFLTSEFLIFVLFVMGLGIGTATNDDVDPTLFWTLTTIATSAYMLSRGIAKAATRSRARDPREDMT